MSNEVGLQEYLDTFHGMDSWDKPKRTEWLIDGLHVEYKYYPSPTGSSSDSWEGYSVYSGGEYLFNFESSTPPERLLEELRAEIKRRKSILEKKIKAKQDGLHKLKRACPEL